MGALQPMAGYSGQLQDVIVLVALLVCLIPTTIGALLSAIGIAGMDRLVQCNVLATSGRAVRGRRGVVLDGHVVGSELIGIDPVASSSQDPYFHTRPSASSEGVLGPGDPSVSGGSNLAGDSPDLLDAVTTRRELIAAREGVTPEDVPPDAVTAPASGVDPHISPAYAQLQVPRVARVTRLGEDQVRAVAAEHTTGRALGFLGAPDVSVLELNVAVQRARAG
ncbi:MAG: potassium-transporting ATPase subunit C [Pseudonocardiaceae bacterium]